VNTEKNIKKDGLARMSSNKENGEEKETPNKKIKLDIDKEINKKKNCGEWNSFRSFSKIKL